MTRRTAQVFRGLPVTASSFQVTGREKGLPLSTSTVREKAGNSVATASRFW